jgi:hypothetical protein
MLYFRFVQLYLAEFNGKTLLGERKTNGKLHSVDRTPWENPVNIKNQWKIPGLEMGNSGKFLSMVGLHTGIFRRQWKITLWSRI